VVVPEEEPSSEDAASAGGSLDPLELELPDELLDELPLLPPVGGGVFSLPEGDGEEPQPASNAAKTNGSEMRSSDCTVSHSLVAPCRFRAGSDRNTPTNLELAQAWITPRCKAIDSSMGFPAATRTANRSSEPSSVHVNEAVRRLGRQYLVLPLEWLADAHPVAGGPEFANRPFVSSRSLLDLRECPLCIRRGRGDALTAMKPSRATVRG
jgi:hypothetical protein